MLVGALALGSPARADLAFPFDGHIAPSSGSFGGLGVNSVAVDDLNGDVYVADQGNDQVDAFEANGTQLPVGLDGSATPAGSFGSGGSFIEIAANDGTGNLYVLDSAHEVVDVFDSTGNYLCQITGGQSPSSSECNGVGSDTPSHGFSGPRGLAVNQVTGEVYVLDAGNGVVDIFSQTGAYVRQIPYAAIPEEGAFPDGAQYVSGFAVSGFNGDVYVGDTLAGRIYTFDGTGNYASTWTGSGTPTSLAPSETSIAVDDGSGDVYVTTYYPQTFTYVLGPNLGYITRFSHEYRVPFGTAVDQATHRVYVSDEGPESTPSVVDVFGPPLTIPDVTTGSASEIGATGATLNGTVDPDGLPVSECRFEYGPEENYGQSIPCVETVGSGNGVVAVHAKIAGLAVGSTYHYRLIAGNANGSNPGAYEAFSTLPAPSIDSAIAANLTSSSVDLQARINPDGYDTRYYFEYGPTVSYGTRVPVSAEEDGDIGAGVGDVAVSAHITGLNANTTYHWRVVASNANGSVGVGHTFVYDTTGAELPDKRAYELVSSPHKDASLLGDDFLFGPVPEISEDGARVMMIGIQCFANAESCTVIRDNHLGTPYESSRSSTSWQTTALSPPISQLSESGYISYEPDAGTALFEAPTEPHGEDDFYLRRADGTFADIGPVTPPADGATVLQSESLESADGSHFVLPSSPTWPFDQTKGGGKLIYAKSIYEYSGFENSQPFLVGVTGGLGSTDPGQPLRHRTAAWSRPHVGGRSDGVLRSRTVRIRVWCEPGRRSTCRRAIRADRW